MYYIVLLSIVLGWLLVDFNEIGAVGTYWA